VIIARAGAFLHRILAMPTFTQRNLAMQGFAPGLPLKQTRWLRMTPSLNTLWLATGTLLASPVTLLGFSVVAAYGARGPSHPFDRLYRWTHGEPLPDNPKPRRFAMAIASIWATATALLFATGHRRAGTIAGAALTLAGASVATTHFCLGSLIYRATIGRDARCSPGAFDRGRSADARVLADG
jgi:hypothetical protein